MPSSLQDLLSIIYDRMEGRFGDLKWWPAESPFEVMVGAVLTQNTSWGNVEKAIAALKQKDVLCPKKMYSMDMTELADIIRPAGYYNVKAERLRSLCGFLLSQGNGDIAGLKEVPHGSLREMLLSIKGIGPETADSILLYALDIPVFVVDAYAKRLFSRHGVVREDIGYEDLRELIESSFPSDVLTLNRFHALIVETGKVYCKKRSPRCGECPLSGIWYKKARGGGEASA